MLLLAIVNAVVGAPTDYASVRAEVVKAYAQQAEEMARALELLQETSASTSAAAQQMPLVGLPIEFYDYAYRVHYTRCLKTKMKSENGPVKEDIESLAL